MRSPVVVPPQRLPDELGAGAMLDPADQVEFSDHFGWE